MIDTKPRFFSILLFSLILLAALGSAGYFFHRFNITQQELSKLKTNIEQSSQQEAKKIVERVAKLMDLPTDEEPVVATVADLEPLKDRLFFAKAKKGDKVLIYIKAKRAILYDPKANKILEVGGITVPTPSEIPAGEVASATTSASFSFTLRNGTELTGLTRLYEEELKKILSDAEVSAHEDAANQDYKNTLLVDLKGDKEKETKQLAETLGITAVPLPEGETKPNSDFLIIVGDDKKNLWLSNL